MKTKHLILAITVPVVVILDQLTKVLAKVYLMPMAVQMNRDDRFVTVIDGFFRLKYAENAGAAWGLGSTWSPGFRVTFFIVVSVAAVIFILWFFRKLEPRQRLLALAVSLVLGGAVGNLIDRIYMSKVVDFIDWYVAFDEPVNFLLFTARAGEHHWPTFNIADVGISVGVALLLIDMIFGKHKPTEEQADGRED